ncbi:MAG TPA: enterotoxin [Gemmatimonadaceae bacterium]|nr:enterotoxin [Gemmatimonadaceae bacterium]
MISRREFLDRSGRLALGAGILRAGESIDAMIPFAGANALRSSARLQDRVLTLGNESIIATWSLANNSLHPAKLTDRLNRADLPVSSELFTLTLGAGPTATVLPSSAFRIVGDARTETLSANASASRKSERLPGNSVVVTLRDPEGRLEVGWRGVLRDGSTYVRQELSVRALSGEVPLRDVTLFDFTAPRTWVSGTVHGSPIVVDDAYYAFEHPLANNGVDGDRVRCRMPRTLPLKPGTTLEVSSVVGVTRSGQLRRDFLAYVERERAHPYRTFLHYNSWYDIGYFSKFSESDALGAVNAFGTELHEQRGVALDSFLFDDGWDDPTTLWRFNSGFPNGFSAVRDATHKFGSAPGVWMSPWGGYGKPHDDRVAFGKQQGFETNDRGFALSGPVYYQRFRDTCMDMIRRYGVNQFKFDGTGNAASTAPGSAFDSDFDAAIHLIAELRAEKPDLYVNLTTGTYPSPFWLRWADSIWRGGEDHSFAGVGSSRQRWITYRDADTYDHVVRAGALFPLSSLMLHGLIYAKSAHNLNTDPGNDFANEVHAYFGNGTQLQEMYITPALLSKENWDAIAEHAKWSRANADTLFDTHWIGGDPLRLEPYGWAAWSEKKGIVTVRNPSERPRTIGIELGRDLELPSRAPTGYAARNPFVGRDVPRAFRAGEEQRISLAPFEVLTIEFVPR